MTNKPSQQEAPTSAISKLRTFILEPHDCRTVASTIVEAIIELADKLDKLTATVMEMKNERKQ